MTEWDICFLYRQAKDKTKQIGVLEELTCQSRLEIIAILLHNKETVPRREMEKLYKRMDDLSEKISVLEKEYREIVRALNGGGK